ncbi:unnamed protein product [Oncorhynchus mykiss]|uniref:Uncharacterized protein n=1 Tax=Oncorhynchus mykiss TaxID=8022 RepID=A0A060YVS6_ONCMY|nr:unnamed protein product [Oncorhynchus mykiss]
MADYSNVAPPSGNGAGMNDAFKDALQRARQIAAKIGGDGVPPAAPSGSEFGYGGQKRPLEDAAFSTAMGMGGMGGGGMGGGGPRSSSEEFKVPDGMVGFSKYQLLHEFLCPTPTRARYVLAPYLGPICFCQMLGPKPEILEFPSISCSSLSFAPCSGLSIHSNGSGWACSAQ